MLMFRQLKNSLALLTLLVSSFAATLAVADGPSASPEKEKEFLAILRSEAPGGEKAIACKQLAIYGSNDSVSELAKLLPNPQLASWARIALEAIPGDAASEALRKGSAALEGRLLIGTLNSIGVRRDAGAVELLSNRLQDKDADVASAAAVALGRIGNAPAAKTLRPLLISAPENIRSAVAEGCVLCAERMFAEGKAAEAVEIYDEVRMAEVPKQRILEATRGAILARKNDGIALLMEQFQKADKGLFNIGLSTAREFPGSDLDKALATELTRVNAERAALIIQAMADRKDTLILSAIVEAAGSGPKPVRLAAITVLSRVGDQTCLSLLLETIAGDDKELSEAAKGTLAELPGDKINAEIAARLDKAEGKMYPFLINLVGQRRIEATPALLKALDNSDSAVRGAALAALGETVALKNLSVLVTQAVSPKHADDADAAQKALKAASVRMPDRDACAEVLAQAIDKAPAATKGTLLDILGEVGGDKALKTLGAAAKSKDPQLQDAGSRVLGKWNSVDAAPVLLDLAKTGPNPQYQVRALRGYIGLARKFAMPEDQRTEMCQKALDTAKQVAEQKLVLDVLKLHPSLDALKLTIKTIQDAELKADATAATLAIAQKLSKLPETRELLSKVALEKVKLEIVKAEFGAGGTQKDVTEILKKQAGDVPLITLADSSYNATFGGDPAPGAVKVLKVQYKINGKTADATFAEDALIVLPMPK